MISETFLMAALIGGSASHDASFVQLPAFPNCCVEYGQTAGLELSAGVGVDVATQLNVFNQPLRLYGALGIRALPTSFRVDEEVGNIIANNTATDGVVEHQLDLSYVAVSIDPTIAVPLPVERLHITVGALFSFPVSTALDQQQMLVSPTDPSYTFENGQRVREVSGGELPQSSTTVAITAGVRYDVPITNEWELSAALRYQHGLNSLTGAAQWSVNSLVGGLLLRYRIPVLEETAPPPPPPPPPPVAVQPPALTSTVDLLCRVPNSTVLGDEVHVPIIDEVVTDTVHAVAPYLFFAQNSTEPLGGQEEMQRFVAAIRQSIVDWTDQRERIVIVGSTSHDEEPAIARQRVSALLPYLPIDQNNVTIELIRADSMTYPELDEEARHVRLSLGSMPRMLRRYASTTEKFAQAIELAAVHTLTCENGPCTTAVRVDGAVSFATTTTDAVIPVIIPAALAPRADSVMPVHVELKTTDAGGQQRVSSATMIVRPTTRSVQRTTVTVDPVGVAHSDGLLLCLFAFDSDVISTADLVVADSIRAALKAGRTVTLVPGTDAIGSTDYNQNLRKRRADAALRYLGIQSTAITVELNAPVQTAASSSPLGRLTQRSVWVRFD